MKYFYEVAPSKIIRSGSDCFTYAHSSLLSIGTIVKISIGKKEFFGIVIKKVIQPRYETKDINEVFNLPGIPESLVRTAIQTADYYATPLANIIALLLPRGLGKKRRSKKTADICTLKRTKKVLTTAQAQASDAIDKNSQKNLTSLLFGVTGSGKTQIYINQALKQQKNGKSAIVLVPEISLTPQLVSEFSLHFPELIVYHSRQTEAERHLIWQQVKDAIRPVVVIGPRSALFLPVQNLGFIAIDEAHEPSYTQDSTPRYSALRVARILANNSQAKLVLGSATPLITDYFMAKASGGVVELKNKARKNTADFSLSLVDMTNRDNFKRHRFISDQLIESIKNSTGQTLVYHNRRGSASLTLCENCGWTAIDETTGIPLVLHIDKNRLINHLTNQSQPVPTTCPDCGQPDIIHKGIGTKLIEQELKSLFPNKKIARFDGDNLIGETLDKSYDKLLSGEIDIIIGTQIVAKGLDLPYLKTVAIIQADAGLAIPDFASNERVFQLISQVVGRVGRNENQTMAIVQTYQKDSEIVKYGIAQDYRNFYNYELKIRHKNNFPPFTFLLKLTCAYKTEQVAIRNAKILATDIKQQYSDVQIFGPAPAFYEKTGDKFRWQITIKSKNREQLKEITKLAQKPYWQFELDPSSLL